MKNLKVLRQKAKMTQQQVSELLNTSRVNYNRYELGTSEPDIEMLKRLSKVFNVSIDFLVDNQNEFTIDLSNLSNTKKELILTKINPILEATEFECFEMYQQMIEQQTRFEQFMKENKSVIEEYEEMQRKSDKALYNKLKKLSREQKLQKEDEEWMS